MNPCGINGAIHENYSRLEKIYHIHSYVGELGVLNTPNTLSLKQNADLIRFRYNQAIGLLPPNSKVIDKLHYSLTLNTSGEVPELSDAKFGGVPDLTNYYLFKKDQFNTKKIWPRCGCCHKYMRFIAQVDLYPWLLPIHALTGQYRNDGPSNDEYGVYSSVGNFNMVQHPSIFQSHFLHIFMCPDSGQHWDNPNFDAAAICTKKYVDAVDAPEFQIDYDAYYQSLPVKATLFKPDKISKVDFKISADCSYDDDDIEDIMDDNREIFNTYHDEFDMFGIPRSQQEPKRYNTTNSYIPQSQMTPLLAFNHPEDDFTYQIYADMQGSNGYFIHCKVDGSCT